MSAVYALDLARLERRLDRLAALRGADVFVPVKAVPVDAGLLAAAARGLGFDTSNTGELSRVADLGRPVLVNGPRALSAAGDELDPRWLWVLSDPAQIPAARSLSRVGIRLDSTAWLPDRGLTRSRFGFSPTEAAALVRQLGERGVRTELLHCHHGSEHMRLADYVRLARGMACFGAELGLGPLRVNVGGGQRHAEDCGEPLEAVAEAGAGALAPGQRLCLEPGGWLFQGVVSLGARVLSVREREPGLIDVVGDVCFSTTLRWSPGAVLRRTGRFGQGPSALVRVFGASCEEGDTAGVFEVDNDESDPAVQIGDTLWIDGVSGYALARASAFNGLEAPAVTFLQEQP
jgi:diaminopimelate decarboxylase